MTFKKEPALIFDLDGTLANCDHRLHHVRNKPKRWDLFFKELINDPVHAWCLEILNRFKNDHHILLVSGRPENYKSLTEQWLKKHNVSYNQLLMRRAGDFRQDDIVKNEIYNNQIKPNYSVLFVVDDRKQVVDQWRKNGLVCLQCNEGNF